ncbi:MAG: HlyU family transcriptional regulator [Pseudomonadota bacterium]
MSLLSRLFGSHGGDASSKGTAPGENYEGYMIYAEPLRDGGKWRVAARIEKEVDGEVRTHRLIRADTLDGEDAAVAASSAKAKVLIDQQGDAIFDEGPRGA